jgi:hypothetical protein
MTAFLQILQGELPLEGQAGRPARLAGTHGTVISFRAAGTGGRRLRWKAGKRVRCRASEITLLQLLTDSSAGLQILWDVVQFAHPGTRIHVMDDVDLTFLHGLAYAPLVEVIEGDGAGPGCHRVVLQRRPSDKQPADGLLPGWSFCLPTGGGDTTALTLAVERILAMRGADFEVVLCGEPGSDFPFRDRVRIIPDPRPGEINLPAKKNALADAARFERIALLHDRVLLPPDFLKRMKEFGPDGGFVGVPIFYFLDQDGLRGRRYSDINTKQRFGSFDLLGPADADRPGGATISRMTAPEVGRFSTYSYVPLRGADRFGFLTGSFYTCSTALWRATRQDESLTWEYFEDVEYGDRTLALGVPHRVLTTTVGLSINGRSTVIDGHGTRFAEAGWQRTSFHQIPFIGFRPARPRAILARDFVSYQEGVASFMKAWCQDETLHRQEEMSIRLTGEGRQAAIADLLDLIALQRIDGAVTLERFLKDFERQILGETLEINARHETVKRLLSFEADLVGEIMDNWAVKTQCKLTDDKVMPLLGAGEDRIPRPLDRSIKIGLGFFVAAAWIYSRREMCLPGGPLATWLSLVRCWPKRSA